MDLGLFCIFDFPNQFQNIGCSSESMFIAHSHSHSHNVWCCEQEEPKKEEEELSVATEIR